MKAYRYLIDEIPAEQWTELTGDGFFASRVYARLWETMGGRAVAWAVEDQGKLVSLLPGVEFGRGPWARFQSMPDGGYGGIFHAREQERDHCEALLLGAIDNRRYLKTFIFDFYGTISRSDGLARETYRTTLVDISAPGWVPPDEKLLSQIRKAKREGIEVRRFSWDDHHAAFLELVFLSEKRHGQKPRFTPDFFAALARVAAQDDRIHWLWCEHENRPACSHIYLIEKGVLQGWQIYFDKAFSFLKPNQYIRFTMCREAARNGITRLNLGGSPENAPGLKYYKERWGGESSDYCCHYRKRGLGKFI
ncbi:MAG: GNAT family N-acetyltransferase [Candidatus Krumholzibacteriota bacterium]